MKKLSSAFRFYLHLLLREEKVAKWLTYLELNVANF